MAYGQTGATWIERVRRYLLAYHREELNSLASGVSANAVSLPFTAALGGIRPGSYVEVDTELFYVQSVDTVGLTAQVIPGQLGTTTTSHLANATVSVNPRFPRAGIFDALNNALRDMSSTNFYQIASTNLTYVPGTYGYDLGDSTAFDIYDVHFQTPTTLNIQPRMYDWELITQADTNVFPSGCAVMLYEAAWGQSFPIRVTYKKPFTLLPDLVTDVAITGLGITSLDLPPLHAAIEMVMSRSIKRSFTEGQPETRRAAEVPAGAVESSIRPLMAYYQQRWNSEVTTFQAQWPPRSSHYGIRRRGAAPMGMGGVG